MLPPVIIKFLDESERRNATHKLFFIYIKASLEFFFPILAQEWKEEQFLTYYTRIPSLLLGGLLFFFFPTLLGALASLVLVFALAAILGKIPSISRQMEIEGHTVEAVFARDYIDDPEEQEAYFKLEAMAMHRLYDQFDGYSEREIYDRMKLYEPWAIEWVEKYKYKILWKVPLR